MTVTLILRKSVLVQAAFTCTFGVYTTNVERLLAWNMFYEQLFVRHECAMF